MKCCICGKEFEGYGNSPYPVNKNTEARCCSECNINVVIPARIERLRELDEVGKYVINYED